jgi:hypothetical protein
MNRADFFAVAALGLACRLTAIATAQPPEQKTAAPQRPALMEVVGCLAEGPGGVWNLINGSEPIVATAPYTTEAALKEAASRSLGTERYRLLGVGPFSAEQHKGQKVAVKGLLIKDSKDNRLNVTSLQMVASDCTK